MSNEARHQRRKGAAEETRRHDSKSFSDVARDIADDEVMRTSYTTAGPGDSKRSALGGGGPLGDDPRVCGVDGHWRATSGPVVGGTRPALSSLSSWSSGEEEGRQGEAQTRAETFWPLFSNR